MIRANKPASQDDVTGSAADFLPEGRLSYRALVEAAQHCRGCELYKHGTQTVFGEGPVKARLMFVGEKVGNQEDKQGHPFVGPAGQLLGRALDEVQIDRKEVYMTNMVKHFKFTMQGKRRLHAKPNSRELAACRPWLDAELAVVKPEIIVALGATAAQGMFGKAFRVRQQRGEVFETELAPHCMATLHPSAVLRIPDSEKRAAAFEDFVADLRIAAELLRDEGESSV